MKTTITTTNKTLETIDSIKEFTGKESNQAVNIALPIAREIIEAINKGSDIIIKEPSGTKHKMSINIL